MTFRYKAEAAATDQASQFGLVAEEVEKVNEDLVYRGPDGRVDGVRYEAVNAMLLNEFLKEHRKVQELEGRLEAVSAELHSVSDAVKKTKPASEPAGSGH